MTDVQNPTSGLILKLIICLVVAASATVVITIYHCITARYLRRPSPPPEAQHEASMDNSFAELLPTHKYRASVGPDGGTCAICLCEFEEGEELRTLPECIHSFHVACIDMWLYSHSNCPMCRSCIGLYSPTLMNFLHPRNASPTDSL